ncbi:ATP-dependent DNA helicase [Trichonephila clavipes]|nr:ATP-dependent DNA helicase [Trichonephila clavipes]
MPPVYFFDDEERHTLERAAQKNKMLTAWFELNRMDPDANRYLYAHIPKHFVWKNNICERRYSKVYNITDQLHAHNTTLMSISHAYVETNYYNLEAERQEGERLMSPRAAYNFRCSYSCNPRYCDEASPEVFCGNAFAGNKQDFASWLLHLGNGNLKNVCQLGENIGGIPVECIVRESIIEEIFGSSVFDTGNLLGKAILRPKNEKSLEITEQVLARFPGQNVTYFNADSIISEDDEEQNNFQLDFINGITPSGMPLHVLNLKVGAVIMLLRNLNPSAGLCNGTRLIIRKLMPNVIDAEILTGHTKGSHASTSKVAVSSSTWFFYDHK